MKVKKILGEHPEILSGEDCPICHLHTLFPIESMECPHCGSEIYKSDFDMSPVGTTNSVEENGKDNN